MSDRDAFAAERRAMVEQQLRARGIRDSRVLQAMLEVPRHLFVPVEHAESAYTDQPLLIGHGQTISQPYMVACRASGGVAGGGGWVAGGEWVAGGWSTGRSRFNLTVKSHYFRFQVFV